MAGILPAATQQHDARLRTRFAALHWGCMSALLSLKAQPWENLAGNTVPWYSMHASLECRQLDLHASLSHRQLDLRFALELLCRHAGGSQFAKGLQNPTAQSAATLKQATMLLLLM